MRQPARGRVALAPGCSLSAWMRLSKGGLTGGVGRCDEDDEEAWPTWSLADVATHNSPEDSWMAVYNITPYLRYHPGGPDTLLDAAGTDATALFQKHHAWVNVEMLSACCVGTLAKPVVTTGQGRRVKWDEQGIQAHDAQRGVMFGTMKIEQLDTPFLYLDEDGGGECVAIHPAYLPSHLPGAKQTGALRPHKMEVDELQHALGLDSLVERIRSIEMDASGCAVFSRPKWACSDDAFAEQRQALYRGEARIAALTETLPDGWTVRLSRSAPCEHYYYHRESDVAQWERPEA